MPLEVIESVRVIRPLKLIALICVCVALLLLLIALSTTTWLSADHFSLGLFSECTSSRAGTKDLLPLRAPVSGSCQSHAFRGKTYIKATAGLLVVALLLLIAAIGLTGFGLLSRKIRRKCLAYRVAMFVSMACCSLVLIGQVVFPVMFYSEAREWNVMAWEFDWGYGLAWGCFVFALGATLLLMCDREEEEVYYKEKTIYSAAVST